MSMLEKCTTPRARARTVTAAVPVSSTGTGIIWLSEPSTTPNGVENAVIKWPRSSRDRRERGVSGGGVRSSYAASSLVVESTINHLIPPLGRGRLRIVEGSNRQCVAVARDGRTGGPVRAPDRRP